MISLLALARALYPICAWFPHGVLVPPSIPVNTAVPTISGTVQVGQTITCSNGSWANNPSSYTFQWQSEGSNLTGAGNPTTSAYTLQTTDIGCLLNCIVTASNGAGTAPAVFTTLAGPAIGATTIYVSQAGNDSTGNGTIGNPYKTLTKVNSLTIAAGTSVLFRRGDTWRNDGCPTSSGAQLSPSSSGTAGNPIVFDAYGTGANPVIDGSFDLSTTGAWTNVSGNVWQSVHLFNQFGHANGLPNNRADDPGNLIWGISAVGGTAPSALVNASYGVMTGGGTGGVWYKPGAAQAGLTATGHWNVNTDTNRIQVFCVGNPATNLPGVAGDLRAAIDSCCIYVNQQSNLTFQNFTIQYTGCTAINTGGAGGTCNNITIRDLVVQWTGGGNISGNSNADSRFGDGWDIEGGANTMLCERIWWHQVFDTGPGPQCGSAQNNITVRNNVCTDCGAFFSTFFLGGVPTCSGLSIYNNTIYVTQNGWGNNPTQRPNGTENVYAIIIDTLNYNATTHVATVQTNLYVANNIFAGIGGINPDPGFGINATAWNIAGSPFNPANPYTASGPGGTGAWLDYNCWPKNIQTGNNQQIALHGGNFDMSAWVRGINTPAGAGTFTPALETHGVFNTDPLFVAQSALNLMLQSGSPCRGSGTNLYGATPTVPPGAPPGVVWDFNHNPRPPSGAFTMGAFQ